jgi:hypothetical protein
VNLGQLLAIGLSVALGVNYLIGMIVNRRKGVALFHWLHEGVQSTLGRVSEARWIGSASSGARLTVAQAREPFRRVEMIYLLATRELLPLLWLQRLRGRRDELILKALLREPPLLEWELVPKRHSRTQAQLTAQGFQPGPELEGWVLYQKGNLTPAYDRHIRQTVQRLGARLRGLSVRRQKPHVVARLSLPTDLSTPAADLFQALAEGLRRPQ